MENSTMKGAPKPESVPYIVFEGELARAERHTRRLWIAVIITVVLLFASNLIWLLEWMSYDYVSTETVTVDGQGGVANYIGNDGDIHNGENSYPQIAFKDETGN